jgi:hypothetical protein
MKRTSGYELGRGSVFRLCCIWSVAVSVGSVAGGETEVSTAAEERAAVEERRFVQDWLLSLAEFGGRCDREV